MRRRGQSEEDRRERLMDCCCPTHGNFLSNTDYDYENCLYLLECPRTSCDFFCWFTHKDLQYAGRRWQRKSIGLRLVK